MSLPPVQISIKRRREEEPVETLYVQSDLQQKKRRFTDFYFRRVKAGDAGDDDDGDGSPHPSSAVSPYAAASPAQAQQQQQTRRTFRSVSGVNPPINTANTTNTTPSHGMGGVPFVRATSPGAELREEKRLAAQRKEKDEYMKNALRSSSHTFPSKSQSQSYLTGLPDSRLTARCQRPTSSFGESTIAAGGTGASGSTAPVRKFQISRSSAPLGPLRSTGRGIQKKRAGGGDGGTPGVAVLVEKLKRKPHSRHASMVADFAFNNNIIDNDGYEATSVFRDGSVAAAPTGGTAGQSVGPRKRPVVNQAERRWREERNADVFAAKQRITRAEPCQGNDMGDESERLARQLEEVALELGDDDDDDDDRDVEATDAKELPSSSERPYKQPTISKPPLKYQPRLPNTSHRSIAKQHREEEEEEKMQVDEQEEDNDNDSDADYVYDTYIRRPLPLSPEKSSLTNRVTQMEADSEVTWLRQRGVDPTTTTAATNTSQATGHQHENIGFIVITPEDEEYWENFVEVDEDDEDKWDSEDADSNAENNPANDYPDEELSSEDECDDPTAMYSRYRYRAASDDEEFDDDDDDIYDFEGASYGLGLRSRRDEHWDDDDSE